MRFRRPRRHALMSDSALRTLELELRVRPWDAQDTRDALYSYVSAARYVSYEDARSYAEELRLRWEQAA